jgi:hypothetical protein
MVNLQVTAEGLEPIIGWLVRLRDFDWGPLAEQIAKILVRGNREARLAGIGVDGQPLDEIKPETVKRRARAGKGPGPPLAPDGQESRVSNLATQITAITPTHVVIEGSWPAAEPWLHHHSFGVPSRNLPQRLIVGITPQMYEEIKEATDAFLLDLISNQGAF